MFLKMIGRCEFVCANLRDLISKPADGDGGGAYVLTVCISVSVAGE